MCYSTSWSALLESVLANACMQYVPTLYCAVPYIVACVDVSRMVFGDHSVCIATNGLFTWCDCDCDIHRNKQFVHMVRL